MYSKPTMSLHELAEAFRANRISTSERMEARYIVEGKYPFAEGVPPTSENGNNSMKIWREPFYEWLAARIPGKVVRVDEQ